MSILPGRLRLSSAGINCPLNYSIAYASFGIRALLASHVPNNAASLGAISVNAPRGLIVSAERPAPVTARHVIGQALPDLMLGCLAQALPERVLAESSGALWTMSISGGGDYPFTSLNVALGGMGARPGSDGLSTTAFPSGVGVLCRSKSPKLLPPLVYHPQGVPARQRRRRAISRRPRPGHRGRRPHAYAAAAVGRRL